LKDFTGVAEMAGLCFLPFVRLASAEKITSSASSSRGFYSKTPQNFDGF